VRSLSRRATFTNHNTQGARMTSQQDLNHEMSNGGTVADWLRTASVAAEVALLDIDLARYDSDSALLAELADAEWQLTQARNEVRSIRLELTEFNS
jgi:hypothetical protein